MAAWAIPLARPYMAQTVVERPPFPYVDGLSFLYSPAADFAASGLTAFICDVSSAERLKTDEAATWFQPTTDMLFRTPEANTQGHHSA